VNAGSQKTQPEPWKRIAAMDFKAMVVLAICVAAAVVMTIGAALKSGKVDWLMIVLMVLAAIALLYFTYRIRIDADGVCVRRLAGQELVNIPIAQILRVGTVTVDPAREFGGFGVRDSTDGKLQGINARSGPGIMITRRTGKPLVVAVSKADVGAARLKAFLAARPPRRP
jgi:hypothetical protein